MGSSCKDNCQTDRRQVVVAHLLVVVVIRLGLELSSKFGLVAAIKLGTSSADLEKLL